MPVRLPSALAIYAIYVEVTPPRQQRMAIRIRSFVLK